MRTFLLSGLISLAMGANAQTISTLEARYFTSDTKANGETDFHGETEWMNLEQRIDFLNAYAEYAAAFWGNPQLETPLLQADEAALALQNIKPQPVTKVRSTIRLSNWKAYGYSTEKERAKKEMRQLWEQVPGSSIKGGALRLNDCTVRQTVDETNWRFRLRAHVEQGEGDFTLNFNQNGRPVLSAGFSKGTVTLSSGRYSGKKRYETAGKHSIVLYGDFSNRRFFLTVDDRLLLECPIDSTLADTFNQLELESSHGTTCLDDMRLYAFVRDTDNAHTPFHTSLLLCEDFDEVPSMDGWHALYYDDSLWEEVELPSVHGGLEEKEESYYLRKKIRIGSYGRAVLKLETLDPGGEVWINGQPVAVVNNRHPQELEVGEYLKPRQENIIAVRVKPYKARHPMLHSPSDPYTGWFLGRTELILTNRCMIKGVYTHTSSVTAGEAVQRNRIILQYNGVEYYEGNLEINYYPWFPTEGPKVAGFKKNIQIRPSNDNDIVVDFPVPHPELWQTDNPRLYKVEVILRDKDGHAVDDYVTTTGIRTLAQKDGKLYINNRAEMLNGAQILGYRYPVETMAKTNRCVPDETIVKDLLMIKKMNGNMLRIHVHAEKDTIDGINDPRYAEYADQLGVCLLWQTAGWVREGEAWNVDFEGYPKYIRQVYNHPSIVMWEAGNHPNRFKRHGLSDSGDYMERIYRTVSGADTSRLISPTSFWGHTHYGNYDGSKDYKSNSIPPNPILMAKQMTRGNQDAYTGYGASWTQLRKAPYAWAKSCLEARDKAFFNFEHEESAAQPNWELARKEPWYEVPSYEWGYEEGSIGRKLAANEWRASQAFQTFSAWESMKKQILLGYDGFSWCSLESGANMFTYQKPLVDAFGVPKLAFYANRQVFERIWAASDNVDVVYGPDDCIQPIIFNLDEPCTADLTIELKDARGRTLERKRIRHVSIKGYGEITRLEGFRFKRMKEGAHFIVYTLSSITPA